jgi:hypothetical protein
MFTLDWGWENKSILDTNFSETPEHKCAHLFKMDNGNFYAYPNNRIVWHDKAWTSVLLDKNPGYKIDMTTYSVENNCLQNTDYSYMTEFTPTEATKNNIMSNTPRTDDQSVRYYDDATGKRIEYVSSRFARQLERELTAVTEQRDGWREAAYSLGEAIPASWEILQPPAEQLRKFKEMVALQNEKAKKLLDNADKHSKMYP